MTRLITPSTLVACHICGQYKPVQDCQKRTIDVETGRSSGSVTVGVGAIKFGSRKGTRQSAYFHSGRTYYKKMEVDVCPECLAAEARREAFWRAVAIVAAGIVLVLFGAASFI